MFEGQTDENRVQAHEAVTHRAVTASLFSSYPLWTFGLIPVRVPAAWACFLVHNTEKHSNNYLCFQNISAKSDNQCAI